MSKEPASGAWMRPIHPATFLWTHPPSHSHAARRAAARRTGVGLVAAGTAVVAVLALAFFSSAQPDSMRKPDLAAATTVP